MKGIIRFQVLLVALLFTAFVNCYAQNSSKVEKAVNETAELSDGEVFLLRDLFKGYEWNRISRSNRLLLGTLFLNKISSENLEITASAKTSSGQQKYQIVRRNTHA